MLYYIQVGLRSTIYSTIRDHLNNIILPLIATRRVLTEKMATSN